MSRLILLLTLALAALLSASGLESLPLIQQHSDLYFRAGINEHLSAQDGPRRGSVLNHRDEYSDRWLLAWKGAGHPPAGTGLLWRGRKLALLNCPAKQLSGWLNGHPGWQLVGEKRFQTCLDLALPLSRTDQVHQGAAGLDRPMHGEGVLVGIVDTGIDSSHPDFWDDGSCRILRYWDQHTDRTYTAEDFEAGRHVSQDAEGHGSHVAGIASGNGSSAAGSVEHGGPFTGHAPGSELLVVASTLLEGDILRAAEWIFEEAELLGRPCVLNLSLETHLGAHDGSSFFENELEAMSGPGRLIVCAAGNSADDQRHAAATYAAQYREVAFTVTQENEIYADLWLRDTGSPDLVLQLPDGSSVSPGPGSVQQDGWRVWFPEPEWEAPYWHVLLQLDGGDSGDAFLLRLQHDETASRSLNIWAYGLAFEQPSMSSTLGIPATGDSMLVAGSVVHRLSWTDSQGRSWYYPDEEEGVVSSFSARGPRVDGAQLPHVLMPGQGMFSSMSSLLANHADYEQRRHPDGWHVLLQGTSMAAPALAGVMALALERDPRIGPSEASALLLQSGSQTWDAAYGVGLPDVPALLAAIESWFSGLVLVADLDAIQLNWTLGTQLPAGFQTLLRSVDGGGFELLNEQPAEAGAYAYTDIDVESGSSYRYRLELLDSSDELISEWQSAPVSLLEAEGARLLSLGPNPWSAGPLTADLVLEAAAGLGWQLFDLRGAEVASGRLHNLPRGRSSFALALQRQLPSGTYIVRLESGRDVMFEQIIRLNP